MGPSSVLVTGATGLLGAALVRQLVAEGLHVRALCRPSSALDLLGDAAAYLERVDGDLTHPDSLYRAVKGVEGVYHVGALVDFGTGRRVEERLRAVNVAGTAHVVNACLDAGVQRLVHTSSIAALGRPERPDQPIDEATPWQASRVTTAYARSKRDAELEVQRGIAEGLDAVLVNPSLIFGVGRPGHNTWQLVERLRDGRMPVSPTGGTNVVDALDVADGLVRAMAHGQTGERYLLGGDNLTWPEILRTLAEALGVAAPRYRLPPRLGVVLGTLAEIAAVLPGVEPPLTRALARSGAQTYRYENRKAIEELGCTFRSFHETAARLAAAAR
ncbi:MAG: SDR family oxidoreductase [Bacteroidota bacterium]